MTAATRKASERQTETCPKCGQFSGDDWKQCAGSCPMPQSPHYSARTGRMSALDRAASVFDDMESDAFHENRRLDGRAVARAIILAAREPGSMALTAVFDAADDYAEVGPQGIWEAGIDAILAEPKV